MAVTAASGQLATAGAAAIPGGATLAEAADAFLSSPRAASPNTRRSYAGVLDRLTADQQGRRPVSEAVGLSQLAAMIADLDGYIERRPQRAQPNRRSTVWR